VRKCGTGIGVRERLWLRQIGNVENEQAVMPVTDVEAIAHAQGMMAARRDPIIPGIGLPAGFPLARNPPATDFDRTGRIREIEDQHDVADITFGGGRKVGIAAISFGSLGRDTS